jgi:hypothetical protein
LHEIGFVSGNHTTTDLRALEWFVFVHDSMAKFAPMTPKICAMAGMRSFDAIFTSKETPDDLSNHGSQSFL